MSKVIKASEINGKYEIGNYKKVFSSNSSSDKKNTAEENAGAETKENSQSQSDFYKAGIKAQKEAEAIIEAAEKKADQIIIKAEQKKIKLKKDREKIYQRIKKQAYQDARQEAQAEIEEASENFINTAKKLEEQIIKEKLEIRKELVSLAVKIASVIINTKIELEPEIINKILKPIFENINESHKYVTVKVNPHLLPHLNKDKMGLSFEKINIEFLGDDDLKAGDCIVRSNLGIKEADLDHKLQLIKKELIKEVVQNVEY
ncbi:MAG: FliH/SctL family protein [Halanaerobium sp.]